MFLAIWFGVGFFIIGGHWTDPKKPFISDYFKALFLLTTWPILLIVDSMMGEKDKK